MIIVRGQPDRVQLYEIDGATAAISIGAVLMPGVTDETNRSSLIIASGAAADAVGLLVESKAASAATDHDPDAGTIFGASQHEVEPFLPGCEVAAEMADDADNDVDVASATSTVLTVTSIEDDIDGSWIYVRAGTGIGQLFYQKASASGTATIKSASTTTLDSTSKLVILRRKFHQLVELNGTTNAATKIASTAAAGSLPWRVLRNEMKYDGLAGWVQLDPTKHHNLQSLNSKHVVFRQILSPADTLYNPLD